MTAGESADLPAALEAIIDANQYMTLATADDAGNPWSSPVWFATVDYRNFFWVSSPDARHSCNLAARPELAITIFDSRQPPGTGTGVYLSAMAAQVPEHELDDGIAVYASVSQRAGAGKWTRVQVEPPAKHRLFRATTVEHFVLNSRDERVHLSPLSRPAVDG